MGKYFKSNQDTRRINKEVEKFTSNFFTLDWKRVKCCNGYYEYDPQRKVGSKEIPTVKIYSSSCTASLSAIYSEIIKKHHKLLPQIEWHIDRKLNVILSDIEAFKNAIPNLIKELEDAKLNKGKLLKDTKSNNSEIISDNMIGTDITISTKTQKYNLQEWNNLIEQKIEEQKKSNTNSSIFKTDYVLNWENLKCINGYYIFIPIISGIFVKTLVIKHPRCTKDYNRIINTYKDHLPQLYFRVNENYEVELSDANIVLLKNTITKIKVKEDKDKKIEKELEKLNRKDEELRKRGVDPSLFLKTFTINWEYVHFHKNGYTFDPNYNSYISNHYIDKLYINDVRSRESFNFIIKYLMKRMPIIHYKITENFTIKLLDTPLLEVAINFLVKEQTKYDIGVGEIADATGRTLNAERLTFNNAMSKAASMKPEDFKKYKSQFINYLILQQHKQYKVVPMSESITHSNVKYEEATFIFTTKGWDNNLLLIIENVNPDRSTVIFRINPNHYTDALQTIFDFMQSDIVNKRSGIREKNLEFSNCGIIEYWSCNHDSFDDWKERMKRHIGKQ